jgi:hypothetical protein
LKEEVFSFKPGIHDVAMELAPLNGDVLLTSGAQQFLGRLVNPVVAYSPAAKEDCLIFHFLAFDEVDGKGPAGTKAVRLSQIDSLEHRKLSDKF